MNRYLIIIFFIFCLISGSFSGRDLTSEDSSPLPPKLSFKVEQKPELFSKDSEGEIDLKIIVPERYHIYGGKELFVEVDCPEIKVEEIIYPEPEIEENFPIYRGEISVKIRLKTIEAKEAAKGIVKIHWQGCQDFGDKVCFMPAVSKVNFELKIKATEQLQDKEPVRVEAQKEIQETSQSSPTGDDYSIFKSFKEKGRFAGFKSPQEFKKWFENLDKGKEEKENLFSRVAKENVFVAILVAFLFGFLSSLTPCVYPVIPITIAYIGSKAKGKGKFSGFLLSLFFVLGLALVYSILGVVSSFLGVSFGSLTQKPIIGISVAIVFALLGLSMLGLFEIAMPSKLTSKIDEGKKKGKGYLGAFLIGSLSGLVVSPCIGPLLLAILVIVASLGSVVLGFIYLFAFALGMGVLFIVIGTFSGLLSSLPKSGSWMDFIKIVFAALIFGGSFYFSALFLTANFFLFFSGLFVGFVLAFLFFGSNRHYLSIPFQMAGSILTLLSFILILYFVPLKDSKTYKEEVVFEHSLIPAAKKALKENKALLIDFRADWCVACIELEKKTWPSKEAQEIFSKIVQVKADFTEESPQTKELTKLFKIEGLPTVILLIPDKDIVTNEN